MRNIVSGTYTGDGTTNQVVDLGFRPNKVELVNVTDGDTLIHVFDDGADGKAFSVVLAAAALTVTPPTINNRGFTSGTNVLAIEAAKVYLWVAYA